MGKEVTFDFACSIPGIDAASLEPGHLSGFDYLGIYNFTPNMSALSFPDRFAIILKLSKYLKGSCFFISKQALDCRTDLAWLNQIYKTYFPIPKELRNYIGIVSIKDGNIDPQPLFEKMDLFNCSDEGIDVAGQVNQTLNKLKGRIMKSTVKTFPWPKLTPILQTMHLSNASLIKRKKKELGLSFDSLTFADNRNTGGTSGINKRSIMKATNGDIITEHVIEHISHAIDVDEEQLILRQLVPLVIGLSVARKIIALHGDKDVRDWFGPLSNPFFDSLNEETLVSYKDIKFIYHHYKKACASARLEAKLEDIVDMDASDALLSL